jgi:ATP-binding cassette, subfamily B, bacterial
MVPIRKSDVDPKLVSKIERTTLRRIALLLRPHVGSLLVILVLLVSSALLNLLAPILLKQVVDRAIPERRLWLFIGLCAGMLAAPVGADVLDVGEKYLTTLVGERVMFGLRNTLYRHLHAQPLAYFTAAKPGAALSSVLNDVQGVGSVVSDTVMNIAQNTTVFCASLAMLFVLEWRFAVIAVLSLPIFALPTRKVGRAKKRIKRDAQEKVAEFVGILSETLSISGALLMKVFGTQEMEAQRVEAKSREIMELSLRQAMVGRWLKLVLGFLENAGPVLLWGVGGYMVMQGSVKLGTLIASTALLKKLATPASGLANVYVDLLTSYAYFDRIYGVLDVEPAIRDAADARSLTEVRGALSFNDVSFSYGAAPDVLSGINLEIEPGQSVAVVGPSGAGKSTLAALVARLYDPTTGSISLDGYDLRRIRLKDLHAKIGVVSQETFLFHATVRENLRYSSPDANDEEIVAAARAANLHDVVTALPDGYETVVGDRGYRLSGGERQRVAIARAILQNPRVLILDEATSALDSKNEAVIQAALEPLLKGRTSLIIAHRLSTIRHADLIVVLDRGKIVERGRHADLMARNGLYASLNCEQCWAVAGAHPLPMEASLNCGSRALAHEAV